MYHGDYFHYFVVVNGVEGDGLEGSFNFGMSADGEQKQKRNYLDLEKIGKRIEGDCLFKIF